MDRLVFLAGHLDWAAATVLEIGALDRPVMKPGSADLRYLDHLVTEDLRGKYRNDPAVDTDALVEVDYAWQDGPMSSAVPDGLRFDLLIASHVFEHIADPVNWLLEARKLLRDDGRAGVRPLRARVHRAARTGVAGARRGRVRRHVHHRRRL